jgi:hypothetical protein
MKKFLLVAVTVAMLSNPAVCMDNDDKQQVHAHEIPMNCGMLEDGTVIVPDRMEVVHGGRNYCAGLTAAVAAGLFVESVYKGNVLLGSATASALAMSAYQFMKREVHVKLYDGQKGLGTILEAQDIQKLIGEYQKQIDDWNKLRREDPAAAQEKKDRIRKYFQQYKEKNAKKAASSEDASEQSQ